MNKHIVFITSSLSQPRVIKRIKSIKDAGFNVKVYGFNRNVYNCNTLPKEIDVINLGSFEDGKGYFKKFLQFKSKIKNIIKIEGHKNVIYYSFAMAPSLFLMLNSVEYIYEISDLFYGYPKFDFIRPYLKILDRRIVKRSRFSVMTSAGFNNYLFGNSPQNNIVIQPNKLNNYFKIQDRPSVTIPDINHLRFGFVGAIRYRNTILRFAKIVGENFPQHEFHFYGDSKIAESFQEETKAFSNIYFHGAFRNPDDLSTIYNTIDIVVACYETVSLNEQIAEPNKLFEAVYFLKPIIVSKNSFLEKRVSELNCGFAINGYSKDEIIELINLLTSERIKDIIKREKQIEKENLIDDPLPIIERLLK